MKGDKHKDRIQVQVTRKSRMDAAIQSLHVSRELNRQRRSRRHAKAMAETGSALTQAKLHEDNALAARQAGRKLARVKKVEAWTLRQSANRGRSSKGS